MRKILTETVGVSFMALMAWGMMSLWQAVTETKPYPVEYVQPISLSVKTPRSIEPFEFYRAGKITLTARNLDCLARNIYYEAGVEDYAGKIAVAQITWNRVRNGRWGNTVCQVVYAKRQFSWTHQTKPAPRGELWTQSLQAADDFVKGTRLHSVQGGKYYHATWIDAPAWTESMTELAVIGQHRFYRSSK